MSRILLSFRGRRGLIVAFVLLLLATKITGCEDTDPNRYVFTGPDSSGGALISGTVQYERLLPLADIGPYDRRPGEARLDFANPVSSPCRFVRILLLDEEEEVLAETFTSQDGGYQIEAPAGVAEVKVRVLAETVSVPRESAPIKVVDNTRNRALYATDSDFIDPSEVRTVDIHLPSGYSPDGSQIEGRPRSSAPFACLDGILTGYRHFLQAGLDPTGLPVCVVNWSERNRPSSGEVSDGAIGTSNRDPETGELYILGAAEADTDEFDWHILIHEFGHWMQLHRFRDDTLGGDHGFGEIKEPRLAFSEGFGNALGGLALEDAVYKDTATPAGSSHSMECNLSALDPNPGWYSEMTVEAVLFDIFDPAAIEGGDSRFPDRLHLPFSKALDALAFQRDSDSLTTIFSFLHGLTIGLEGEELAHLRALLAFQSPSADYGLNSLDEFAQGETHDAGIDGALPVYLDVTHLIDGAPLSLTFGPSEEEVYNNLRSIRILRFRGDGTRITVTVRNSTSSVGNVGLLLYENGELEEGETEEGLVDNSVTVDTSPGEVYIVYLLNLGPLASTTDVVLTHEGRLR